MAEGNGVDLLASLPPWAQAAVNLGVFCGLAIAGAVGFWRKVGKGKSDAPAEEAATHHDVEEALAHLKRGAVALEEIAEGVKQIIHWNEVDREVALRLDRKRGVGHAEESTG